MAEALGVRRAVRQGMRRARDGGPEGPAPWPPSGAPRRLAADLLARLPTLVPAAPTPRVSGDKGGPAAGSPPWAPGVWPLLQALSAACSKPSAGARPSHLARAPQRRNSPHARAAGALTGAHQRAHAPRANPALLREGTATIGPPAVRSRLRASAIATAKPRPSMPPTSSRAWSMCSARCLARC